MTIEQFNKTRWTLREKVYCNPMCVQYEPYEAYVVSIDLDQCLIGVMTNPESDDEDIRWLRCENCEIINPEKKKDERL